MAHDEDVVMNRATYRMRGRNKRPGAPGVRRVRRAALSNSKAVHWSVLAHRVTGNGSGNRAGESELPSLPLLYIRTPLTTSFLSRAEHHTIPIKTTELGPVIALKESNRPQQTWL